jgi:hypothetical protein
MTEWYASSGAEWLGVATYVALIAYFIIDAKRIQNS